MENGLPRSGKDSTGTAVLPRKPIGRKHQTTVIDKSKPLRFAGAQTINKVPIFEKEIGTLLLDKERRKGNHVYQAMASLLMF